MVQQLNMKVTRACMLDVIDGIGEGRGQMEIEARNVQKDKINC